MQKKVPLMIAALLFQSSTCYALDTVKINDKNALFTALEETVPIVTSNYIGWQDNWKWANSKLNSTHRATANNLYQSSSFTGQVKKLAIGFTGTTTVDKNTVIWNYQWQKNENMPNAIGYGLNFNLKLKSPSFSSPASDPELLADNKGWSWKTPDGRSIEVQFTPALAKIYFEKGKKNKIRALFFTDIKKGNQQTKMRVKISEGVTLAKPMSLNYSPEKLSTWHQNILPAKTSPIDLSFLNKNERPAGKHGFIKANADKLAFEDGTEVKFWGANIQAYALFKTSDEDIKLHAKRISELGFNLIRIHHHDSKWVKPNIFKNPKNNTLELSQDSFKKLDWWIHCLKEEGVYIWLDLHVGRRITQNDKIDNFKEISKGKDTARIKGFNYYNDSVKSAMKDFNQAYLSHVNPFTKLSYKDDPAVMAMLITNENDLTRHFSNLFLGNRGVPKHQELFYTDIKNFAERHDLAYKNVKRTWKMGESKIYLNDVEHRFNQDMLAHLKTLSVKSLIATTNSWGKMGLFGLPSLTDGSIIDAHSYGDAEEINDNPRYQPSFLSWIAASQVSGKPLSVTEWNIEPFPARDRFIAPTFTASIANLQGWDAMMLYGYSQLHLRAGKTSKGSNYSSFNDPAIMGLMPAAALLYRQNHVAVAKKTYQLKLDRENLFFKKQSPQTSKTIRTLLESSRLTIAMPKIKELPWLKESASTPDAIVINDANKDFIPAGQNFVESDTGELKRDWNKGIQTINTAKSQIASGWIGGEEIKLRDAIFKISTKKAIISIQSLENKAIRESNAIFITVMARSKTAEKNKGPFLSEPVTGEITVFAPKGLTLYAINQEGKKDKSTAAAYDKGAYKIYLSPEMDNYWFTLEK